MAFGTDEMTAASAIRGSTPQPSANETNIMNNNTIIQFDSMEEVREFARQIYKEMISSMRDDSKLLTAKDAAETLNISVSTLYRMEKRGMIDSVTIDGSAKRYRACDIRWLASGNKTKRTIQ